MTYQIKIVLFLLGSAVIILLTRKSLKSFSVHGFYRLFAFEFILVLFLINVDYWFVDPFSGIHILSWLILFISIYFAVAGIIMLKLIGKPDREIKSDSDYTFEKTTKLVTIGLYKHIRHPMYASLLYLAWGIYFKNMSPWSSLLMLLATFFLYVTARVEENENVEKFGKDYLEYMKKSKMFVPFLF
jgi:protein-S-isoprenylcysteine O-methyltransferase Ste14